MNAITVVPATLKRAFNAPQKLVYEAWTQEQHLCQWQVPNSEVSCVYRSADIRSGGSALYKMVMPSGKEMWLLTKYHDLNPYDRIVFTQYESNENGDVLSPSMPNWPKEIRATINLNEVDGVTYMEFVWQPVNPTQAEADAWESSRAQFSNGWGGSFELLAGYLAQN
ncbi:hypothetical protein GCM10008090_10320 [Arenicella chitinivorans]|uniref:Activator of Hsp90 ATPase homologue 1/2-like C-terminal domain-containing protein n=1 Tax=Arenicella chitinivorans TaxID=1329800 RepID=A0A918RLS3_9GAMM|nr:SRPBCC domain-containing protein [Arenicella chitinivorans]GHA03254.1 hypothetical protein GCM10008090_10320 [Arenicella chitinivorans]